MRDLPGAGEVYRHFKGGIYEILALARHSETLEELVVYRNKEDPSKVYARPLPLLMSPVDHGKYPEVKEEWRFTLIDEGKPGLRDNEGAAGENRAFGYKGTNTETNAEEPPGNGGGDGISEELIMFLDAGSLEEKLEVLERHQGKVTDEVLNAMAVSLDTEIRPGPIAQRIGELKDYLLTTLRFEGAGLRERRGRGGI